MKPRARLRPVAAIRLGRATAACRRLRGDRIVELELGLSAAEQLRLVRGEEQPGDRFIEPEAGKPPPHRHSPPLQRRQHQAGDRVDRRMGVAGTWSSPTMRQTSSTRSASPRISGRKLGTWHSSPCSVSATVKPSG